LHGSRIFEYLKELYGVIRVDLGDNLKGVESNKHVVWETIK